MAYLGKRDTVSKTHVWWYALEHWYQEDVEEEGDGE